MDEFPHTITFQAYVSIPDGGGGYEKGWKDLFTTEAHVQPINGDEYTQAQQLTNPIDHNIFYPYQEGVNGSMRVIWHDRNDSILELRSNPLDQGGIGEIFMVKAQLNG